MPVVGSVRLVFRTRSRTKMPRYFSGIKHLLKLKHDNQNFRFSVSHLLEYSSNRNYIFNVIAVNIKVAMVLIVKCFCTIWKRKKSQLHFRKHLYNCILFVFLPIRLIQFGFAILQIASFCLLDQQSSKKTFPTKILTALNVCTGFL